MNAFLNNFMIARRSAAVIFIWIVSLAGCSTSSDSNLADVADGVGTDVDEVHQETYDGHDGQLGTTCESVALPPVRLVDPVVVKFSLDRSTALDSHVFVPTEFSAQAVGYGGGGALIDFNADGLVDVFLGQRDSAGTVPCLYINESLKSETRFRVFRCFPELGAVAGARTIDIDGDGDFELLTYGEEEVNILHFNALIEITEVVSNEDFGEDCAIYTAIEHPTNPGTLVVAFGEVDDSALAVAGPTSVPCEPVVIAPSRSGYADPVPWEDASFSATTLALGRGDIDQDGLLDTAFIVDTTSNPHTRETSGHPGGFLRGTSSVMTSGSSVIPWVFGSKRAWGSFMGAAQIVLQDTAYTLLSDWGPPLLRGPRTGSDSVQRLQIDTDNESFVFSWSPIVVDFNFDGRDDILLTRGFILGSDGNDEATDLLLIQSDSGFSDETVNSGLLGSPLAYDDGTNRRHLSRAGIVTDFDRDGRLEVIIVPYEGRPLLYEAESATHCLARVNSPYLEGPNGLYGWSWLDASDIAHPLRMDAAMRLGDSQWLVVPSGKGVVRAPSGARINYECKPGERVTVHEPEWAISAASELTIDACAGGFETSDVFVTNMETGAGISSVVGADERLLFPMETAAVKISLGGRYSLSCGPDSRCSR